MESTQRGTELRPSVADPAPSARPNDGTAPLEIRSLALISLVLLGIFHTLYVAKTLVFPILVAVLAYFALTPIVRGLRRFWIPVPLGAAVVVAALIAAMSAGIYFLSTPATNWAGRLPLSLTRIEQKLRAVREPIEEMVAATDKVEDMAKGDDDASIQKVEVRRFSLAETILNRTWTATTTTATVLVLLYFLLASGDAFFRKVAEAVPQIADKDAATNLIQRAESEISHYLLTVSLINGCLGGATALVLWALDMPNPLLWGACAATLNFIPFLGSAAMATILFAAALLHYGTFGEAIAPPLLFAALSSAEGLLITPTVLGRRLALSPIAIFASLLVWSWLWGIPGALVAVPTLATIKIVCDQLESLRAIGAILGR
jgi:predicted PurR-regulated permease PerM